MNEVNCTALQHMFAVHGAALVAPYGGMSVGAMWFAPSPLAVEGPGMRGR